MKPQEELPSSITDLEDYYNMSNASSQEINTQHMEGLVYIEHRVTLYPSEKYRE